MPFPGNPREAASAPDPSRRALRASLLEARARLPDRAAHEAALAQHLTELLRASPAQRLAAYWPTRGECDLRDALAHWLAAKLTRRVLLPVATEAASPLQFRRWTPGCDMATGAYGIPIPCAGETEIPDTLLIPCVGFDAWRYRIGYGGGFYDRTLAALRAGGQPPRAIGIAFEASRVASVMPQPHDLALDCIVTERGVF